MIPKELKTMSINVISKIQYVFI